MRENTDNDGDDDDAYVSSPRCLIYFASTYDDDDVTYDLTTILASINPSLPNGTIFNETDTYKYFMFDGTDTWNQMVSS